MWQNTLKLVLISILIGILLGVFGATAAHYFRAGIHFIEQFVNTRFDNANRFILLFCSLSIAAFIISLIKAKFSVIRWHGPSDTIFAAHRVDNELDIKSGVASTLAAFFSAAGGASVGQYGPLVHFGATLGSWLKAILKLRINTDIVLGGGVAAAISAGFSAPLTGIIFAHEAILRHFSFKALAPIALASGTAIVIHNYLWNSSTFIMGPYSATDVGPMILISIAAGPFFGFVAILFMFTILTFAKLPTQMGLNQFQSFLIAITGLSIIGTFYPEVMGLGTTAIINLTAGSTLLIMAVAILFGKIIATALSLGFGFFGGVFSPALLVGAAAGSIATSVLSWMGIQSFQGPELIICGMAAVAGSVIGAPISMIMIVLELTGSYSLALASTIGIVTATMISGQLFEHSIFDKQLLSRGIDLSQGRMGIRLMEENITKITSSNVLKFKPEVTVDVAKAEMVKMQVNEAYVNTHEGKYIGKLHLKALIFVKPSDAIIKYTDTEALNIKSDASLQQAIETAANFIGETIPIVDRSTGTLIGTINEGDLLKMYLDLQGQTIDLEKR
ncbi:Voltage-gated ClC-type chloride channel ClcB [Rhodobacteraceae bacterium IMCC1933]|nr:Voltage-gated ClC-type chloride channel ClcB [Rhodobacteraceae bacterium IMCC1923]MDP4068861.1 Voltage-gated ClC-type chloride channel ClcB [Rhodobacteraceae bacterium IMCC1933]MDP4069916.1 Voltage-gated ClC-type chloride channel ClcB [Rhodobacteraceae bacterium IMCC1909]